MNDINKPTRPISQRITAIGFIAMTIAGNFWLVAIMLGKDPHLLVVRGFELGMVTVAVGGIMMLIDFVKRKTSISNDN